MTKRKYRTDEEWLSLIQECRLSGLTDKQWCEAHQICPSNFYYQIKKFRNKACEIPKSQSKTTLTAQKQEVVQVTFEQPAVSEHPQSCLPKDAKADAAILVQINGFQIGITNAASAKHWCQTPGTEEFISIINQYMQWYRDKRIKLSLGGLSPMEYRRSFGIA